MKPTKNIRISPEYQERIKMVHEEVKNGNCSTLRECLILFEKLWNYDYPENLLISNRAREKLEKLQKDDPKQYSNVIKKISQIQENPEHFKPLSGDLSGSRRVHIGDFVLIYSLVKDKIIILDYDHHKKIYLSN